MKTNLNTPPIKLEQLSVAKPCSANWDAMPGDERVRHCGMCKMNVYNLSEMSREEAEKFVSAREGRTCIQYFQRADGTVLTKDCPVGVKRVRQRMAILAGGLAASIFFAAGSVLARMGFQRDTGKSPAQAVNKWVNPPAPTPVTPPPVRMVKGEMCVPTPPVVTPKAPQNNPVPAPVPAIPQPNTKE